MEDNVDDRFMEQLHKWEYLVPFVIRPQLIPEEPDAVCSLFSF